MLISIEKPWFPHVFVGAILAQFQLPFSIAVVLWHLASLGDRSVVGLYKHRDPVDL